MILLRAEVRDHNGVYRFGVSRRCGYFGVLGFLVRVVWWEVFQGSEVRVWGEADIAANDSWPDDARHGFS